jgi:uncharacterized protein with PQ loop repeat
MAWLKNTDGTKSASFTMMIIAFTAVTLWLTLSIVTHIGPITVRSFSGTEAMAYLTPILALYWGRRQQEVTMKLNTATPAVIESQASTQASSAPTCECTCTCCKDCESCSAK